MPDPDSSADADRLTATHAGPARSESATIDAPSVHSQTGALPLPSTAGRYEILEEVARGGMGAILRVRDPDLRRDLAIKLLLPEHAGRPAMVHRFLEEAQITGQLQHPGVVPVHEVGTLADGRPFFSMKLIKGRTLAGLLTERTEGAADVSRFLPIFEQICLAVAYAHSRGVIHRDLKPSNVMVGAFGEVQVMDWGLAKLLTAAAHPPSEPPPGERGATVIRTTGSDSGQGDTNAGSVMGTPAYMPPEQALGEIATLDERCDVFSLGAILCEVLTGQPPYAGGDNASQLRRAARADLADAHARLERCSCDAELIALAKRCLAPEPADRPRDAGQVAAATAEYRAGVEARVRRAELERAAAETRAAEERKRRHVQLALAASVLLLFALGGAGAWWLQHQRHAREQEEAQRREGVVHSVELALSEAQVLLDRARQSPLAGEADMHDALNALQHAEELAERGEAGPETLRKVEAASARAEALAERMKRDRKLLNDLLDAGEPRETPVYRRDKSGAMIELPRRGAGGEAAEALRAWGLDVDSIPTTTAAAQLRELPPPIRVQVVAALDRWTEERRRAGRSESECRVLSDLAAALDDQAPGHRQELRELLVKGRLPMERMLCEFSEMLMPAAAFVERPFARDSNRLRQLASAARPADEPVTGIVLLAHALRTAGEDALAESLLRDAIRARPQEVAFHDALGQLMAEQSRWSDATECYSAARALRPGLGVRLADVLQKAGRQEAALALLAEIVRRDAENPDLLARFGDALLRQDRPTEAEPVLRRALKLQPNDAYTQALFAFVLEMQGDWRKAEAAYREAIRLRPDYASAHAALGHLLNRKNLWVEAAQECRRAIELAPNESLTYSHLALAQWKMGQLTDAEASSRTALERGADDASLRCSLGDILAEQGKFSDALAEFQRAEVLEGPAGPGRLRAEFGVTLATTMQQSRERLVALAKGAPLPETRDELVALADLCLKPYERRYLLATRLFAAIPDAVDDSIAIAAAHAAAQAAVGQGTDASNIGPEEWAWLQAQALRRLRQNLSGLQKAARFRLTRALIPQAVKVWKDHADFAAFRDESWLAAMPAPDQSRWRQFWSELNALLEKAKHDK